MVGKHKEEKDSTVFENGREANDKSNPNSLEEEISSALEELSKRYFFSTFEFNLQTFNEAN